MTRRTLNFTGRKRIAQKHVKIDVDVRFDVSADWELEEYDFPGEARVYVEAHATSSGSPVVLRFPFGTVARGVVPNPRSVEELTNGNFGFSFKVVDESQRLLGVVENIRATGYELVDDEGVRQQPLLPVVPTQLGDEVWRLTYVHSKPWLEVNNRVPDIMARIRSDASFFALVYPAILREIFTRILVIDEFTEVDADVTEWQGQWLRWGVQWHPDHERPAEGERRENVDSWNAWIGTVVGAFCRFHDAAGKYAGASTGDDQ